MTTNEPMFRFGLVIFSLMLLVRTNLSYAQHLNTVCFESAPKYRANSTFQHNLNSVLSTITSNISSHSGFFNAARGHGANKVYGLAQCRGDVPSTDCLKCTNDAVSQIVESCNNQTSAIIWFDNCLLRYSHTNFFGVFDKEQTFIMTNVNNASDPSLLEQKLKPLLRGLISTATSNESALMFAGGSINYNDTQTIHGMAQCTRDLSLSNCRKCLEAESAAIPIKQGARVVGSSCTLRYEMYPFLLSKSASPAPSPAPLPFSPSSPASQPFSPPSPEPSPVLQPFSPPSPPPEAPLPPAAAPSPVFGSAPQSPVVPVASPLPQSSGNRISSIVSQSSVLSLLVVFVPIAIGLQ